MLEQNIIPLERIQASIYLFHSKKVMLDSSLAELYGIETKYLIRQVEIMRTFVKLREIISSNTELAGRLSELEKKYDSQFKIVFDAIRQLMSPAITPKKKIGFLVNGR